MKKITLLLSVLFLVMFQACSQKPVQVKPRIVFPSYPEEPKILYLDTFKGEGKGEEETMSTVVDTFLGESEGKSSASNTIIKPYGVGLKNGKIYVADTGSNVVLPNQRPASIL